MSGSLKKRIDSLHASLIDHVGSEIVVKDTDKVLARSRSKKKCNKLIRIVVNV